MGECSSRIWHSICCCLKPEGYEPIVSNDDVDADPEYVPYQSGSVSSARRHPSRPSVDKGGGVGASLRKISVDEVGIEDIDQQYKVHSEAFNDCYDRFNQLRECYQRMLSAYDSRGYTHSNLSQVFKIYKAELDDDQQKSIAIKRKHQYCMQLHFNGDKIPGEGAQMFEDFNLANLITKDIAEKEPIIISNAMMLVSNEEQFRQRIRNHYSTEQALAPEKIKICVHNTAEIKKVKPFMEYIRKETGRMFDDFRESIRVFAH